MSIGKKINGFGHERKIVFFREKVKTICNLTPCIPLSI
jgi:hypothetical protein